MSNGNTGGEEGGFGCFTFVLVMCTFWTVVMVYYQTQKINTKIDRMEATVLDFKRVEVPPK